MTFALADHKIRSLYDEAKDKKSEVPILAELCAVPLEAMAAKLRDLGYDLPEIKRKGPAPSCRKRNTIDEARALALSQEGLDDLQIAERLGVSASSIGAWRRKRGHFRPKGGKHLAGPRKQRPQPPTPPEAETAEPLPEALPASVPPQTLGRVLLELAAAYPALSVLADGRPVSGFRLDSGKSNLILECEKPC